MSQKKTKCKLTSIEEQNAWVKPKYLKSYTCAPGYKEKDFFLIILVSNA